VVEALLVVVVEVGVEEEEEEGLLLGKIDAKHRYFLHKY
jgi:hypothetical protein